MKRTIVLLLAVLVMVISTGLAAPKEMNLRVTDPGENSEWVLGTANIIKWSYRGELGDTVAIRLQRAGWVNAQMAISESVPIGEIRSGSYKWTVPTDLPPGGKYTVSVTAANGIGDISGEFMLAAGKGPTTRIELEAPPKGGDRWAAGAKVILNWTYAGTPGQTVKLALIKKEEGDVTAITASVPIGTDGKGRYEWKVPALKPGNDYYVGIASTSNAFYQDMGKVPVNITATR